MTQKKQQINELSERAKAFERALALISEDNVRNYCIELLDNADGYFFTEPASSSGKYHPAYAHGIGGLMRHSIAVAVFMRHILDCDMFQDGEEKFSEHEKNLLVCGAIVHDIKKYGKNNTGRTVKEHPEIAAEYINESNYNKYQLTSDDIQFISSAVESHMGQWGKTVPTTNAQKLLHIADYLASRKDLSVDFGSEEDIESKITLVEENINPGDYVMPFGKFKGVKLAEVDNGYINWLANDFPQRRHKAVQMAKKYLTETYSDSNEVD